MLREKYDEHGCLFAGLLFVVSVPITALLVWAGIMLVGGIFDVFIDVDRAFGIIFYTSLSVGPALVAWRLWLARAPRSPVDEQ